MFWISEWQGKGANQFSAGSSALLVLPWSGTLRGVFQTRERIPQHTLSVPICHRYQPSVLQWPRKTKETADLSVTPRMSGICQARRGKEYLQEESHGVSSSLNLPEPQDSFLNITASLVTVIQTKSAATKKQWNPYDDAEFIINLISKQSSERFCELEQYHETDGNETGLWAVSIKALRGISSDPRLAF